MSVQELMQKFAEQQRGGVPDEGASNPALARVRASLSDVAVLILQSDARSQPGDIEAQRNRLAQLLGCVGDDLEEIVQSVESQYQPGVWGDLVIEERTKIALDSAPMRAATWDRIETLALRKLGNLVERGIVHKAPELLAIATAANRAARNGMGDSGNRSNPSPGVGVNIFMNQTNAPANDGSDLPKGNLGSMTLQLSPRLRKQAEREPTDSKQVLANSKMLEVDELRQLGDESDAEIVEVHINAD